MLKYIRLYEEYRKEELSDSNNQYSWQNLRDTIQLKHPFIIIDFESTDDLEKCINDELFDEDYVKQEYIYKTEDSDVSKKPSVFIFEKGQTDLADRVLDLHKRFDIYRIIIGKFGKEDPSLYVDGEEVEIGSNLFTSISIDEIGHDDYYKFESNYYRFIN